MRLLAVAASLGLKGCLRIVVISVQHYAKTLLLTLISCAFCVADQSAARHSTILRNDVGLSRVLDPPPSNGPVRVRVDFHLLDINNINEEAECFEFIGVLTLRWLDQRQAFDPVEVGVDEKVYQGTFQYNELSPSWFPQVMLANASGLYEKSAVILRVRPDGSCILMETVNAVAEAKLNLRRTPFDSQRLEAVFQLFGFDADRVLLEAESVKARPIENDIRMPQWTLKDIESSIRSIDAPYLEKNRVASAYVLSAHVHRKSFFIVRLVIIPLAFIVCLSWSVFWMDQASMIDRVSISFVGILTAVTYQIVLNDIMPHIASVTLLNGFVTLSFFLMCVTVIVNLMSGRAYRRGETDRANRIDEISRFVFPLAYLSLAATFLAIAFW